MIETILYYVLPNIVLFGGIIILGKFIEDATWNMIIIAADAL